MYGTPKFEMKYYCSILMNYYECIKHGFLTRCNNRLEKEWFKNYCIIHYYHGATLANSFQYSLTMMYYVLYRQNGERASCEYCIFHRRNVFFSSFQCANKDPYYFS